MDKELAQTVDVWVDDAIKVKSLTWQIAENSVREGRDETALRAAREFRETSRYHAELSGRLNQSAPGTSTTINLLVQMPRREDLEPIIDITPTPTYCGPSPDAD